MLSPRSNIASSSRRLRTGVFLLIIAGALIVLQVPMPAVFSNMVHVAVRPLWSVRDAIVDSLHHSVEQLRSKNTLIDENTHLKQRIAILERQTFLSRVLERENSRLRAIVNRSQDSSHHLASAVINSTKYSPYDSFVIDRGTAEGVQNGMVVRTPEGYAVGSIVRVLEHTAIVTAFSAASTHTDVFVAATTTIRTTLQGQGGGSMVVKIPRELECPVDTPVLLPNFETSPIGFVSYVEVAPQDAFQTVYVRSPVNLQELQFVLVDTSSAWTAIDLPDEVMTTASTSTNVSE